jgi:hypothetical protein
MCSPALPSTPPTSSTSSRPELPFRSIVGWFDVAAPHEDEQLVASINDDGVSQMPALGVSRFERKQAVEVALERARGMP